MGAGDTNFTALDFQFYLVSDTKSAKVFREKLLDLYPDMSQTPLFNDDRFEVTLDTDHSRIQKSRELDGIRQCRISEDAHTQ